MAPKKKGMGKMMGKKKEEIEAEIPIEDSIIILQKQLDLLNNRYVEEKNRASECVAAENELRHRVLQLDQDFLNEQRRSWDITCDMTRQYKSMQEETDEKIDQLTKNIVELDEIVEQKEKQIEGLVKKREEEIQKKDDEIKQLKHQIEKMAKDFSTMLENTLEALKEKVELTNQWEQEGEQPVQRRVEEFKSQLV